MNAADLGRPLEVVDPTERIDEVRELSEAEARVALSASVLADAAKFKRGGVQPVVPAGDAEQSFVLSGQDLITALLAGGVHFGLMQVPEGAGILRTEVEIAKNGVFVKIFTGRRKSDAS